MFMISYIQISILYPNFICMTKIFLTFAFIFLLNIAYGQDGPPSPELIRKSIADEITGFHIPPEKDVRTVDQVIQAGPNAVRLRLYYGSNKPKLPVIYQIHGGALVAGDLDTHDNICRLLAKRTGSLVIAIDYPRPPEHPYPAGVNACFMALKWINTRASKLGGMANGITIIGDSGGALFASGLIVKMYKEDSRIKIRATVLINPAEDLRNPGEGMYGLVTKWYLHGADANDPVVSPVTQPDMSIFPPTLIVVCADDDLKPHGIDMATKLKAAGVKTTLIEIPNEGHLGGLWAAGHPKAQVAINAAIQFMKDEH
jgi:acetyl esterase